MSTLSPSSIIGILAVIGIGCMLSVAGCSKLLDSRAFRRTLDAVGVFPREVQRSISFLLPLMEILVGLCMIAGLWLPWIAYICTGLFICFSLVLALVLVRGHKDVECGCLGPLWAARPVSWSHVAFTILCSSACIIVAQQPEPSFDSTTRLAFCTFVFGGVAGLRLLMVCRTLIFNTSLLTGHK